MSGGKFQWPDNYDPHASMKLAMLEVAQKMEKCNGSFEVSRYMAMVADVEMWTRIAQVHATNALTMATEAQLAVKAPKTCRCIRD